VIAYGMFGGMYMKVGKIHVRKNILVEVLLTVLVFSVIFSLAFNSAIQMTSVVHTGYYRIFKDGKLIGNIKHYEDIKPELVKKYGPKVPDDFSFGDGVAMEYTAYEDLVTLSDVASLLPQLDVQVNGLDVKTDNGQEFKALSYREWREALGNVLTFVQTNAEDKKSTVRGEVRIVEHFNYSYKKMSIDDVYSQKEIEQALIFRNKEQVKNDTVQATDTVERIAQRNQISAQQLAYVNEIDKNALLVPGTQVDVSPLDYSVSFSYPIIENIVEDINFEIRYEDDDSKYSDEEEILQHGVNGSARAQYLSYVINGKNEPGQRLEYEVLREPVEQVIKRGTKERRRGYGGASASDAPYSNEAGFIWPTEGLCISAEYMDPTYGGPHYGLDIAGNYGESVWTAAAGTVESAEFLGAWGNQVLVRHSDGIKTRYAHLTTIGVNRGEELRQGNYVGAMGSTGLSTGVHLHFEVHVRDVRRNPLRYLPRPIKQRC